MTPVGRLREAGGPEGLVFGNRGLFSRSAADVIRTGGDAIRTHRADYKADVGAEAAAEVVINKEIKIDMLSQITKLVSHAGLSPI